DAAPAKVAREREAHRAGAHDQDRGAAGGGNHGRGASGGWSHLQLALRRSNAAVEGRRVSWAIHPGRMGWAKNGNHRVESRAKEMNAVMRRWWVSLRSTHPTTTFVARQHPRARDTRPRLS